MPEGLSADQAGGIAERVLRWQPVHGRHDLPWQGTRDPYRVWLSEIMLQQTQVATVRHYYTRFVQRLPDVQALAAAEPDAVLALWSGLGYYRRARNLHRCAQVVVQRHGGVFPSSAAELQTLPGIGRSTAAAIAAVCFGERVAILDGNVRRVLARALGFAEDLAGAAAQRRLWDRATELLPRHDLPRTMPVYTQGLMDLGAGPCSPRRPACSSCPIATVCVANSLDSTGLFPVKTRKLKRRAESLWLLWAQTRDGAVWLQRRPPSGVWAGLHCLPGFDSREALLAALGRVFGADDLGGLEDLPVVRHVLTHKDLHLHPVRVVLAGDAAPGGAQPLPGAWQSARQWPGLGLPAPVRRLLQQDG
ncbi:MAG: A/G-specific adenine glycosylase [Rhodoferax sp.]|nr:A/G-specific adenine glycosylase [Rhodoferax sp.]